MRYPALHLVGDCMGKAHRRGIARGGAAVAAALIRFLCRAFERAADGQRRPQLDLPRLRFAKRQVRRLGAIEPHGRRPAVDEPAVDDFEHRRGRAIIGFEVDILERLPGPLAERAKQIARGGKGGRVGPLEAKDRLFAVADGEQRAQPLGIVTVNREKFLGERQYDAPLAHIRILRLVDKDVIGALVELEAHPFAEIADAQQRSGERDEVVEVGEPALAFRQRIAFGKAAAEQPRRRKIVGDAHRYRGRAQLLRRLDNPHRAIDAVGHPSLVAPEIGAQLALAGQEAADKRAEHRRAPRCVDDEPPDHHVGTGKAGLRPPGRAARGDRLDIGVGNRPPPEFADKPGIGVAPR